MKLSIHTRRTTAGYTDNGPTQPYAVIERDHVPQIGARMECAATADRRAMTGVVHEVIEICDPSVYDRPSVTIVVEEFA